MIQQPPAPVLTRLSSSLCTVAALWLAAAMPLHASPEAPGGAEPRQSTDALLQLLIERDLLGTAAPMRPAARELRDGAAVAVLSALNFLGLPYRRGGDSAETGFDCSGFTRHVFESSLGLSLPRRADQQARSAGLQPVQRDALQPGDLVFFNTLRRAFSHVGIYIGEGRFIHAPRSGTTVRVENMRSSYWSRRFDGARRVEASDRGGATRP